MNRYQKQQAGLATRIREFNRDQPNGRNNANGQVMHKPGSNKKGMYRIKKGK